MGLVFQFHEGFWLHDQHVGLTAQSAGMYPIILQQVRWPHCMAAVQHGQHTGCRSLSATLPITHIQLSMLYFAFTAGGGAAKLLSIYAPAVSDTVHELWHSLNSLSTDFLVIIVIMFVWCFSDLLNVMVNKKTACRFLINFSSQ